MLRHLDHNNIIKSVHSQAGENSLPLAAIPDSNYYNHLETSAVSLNKLVQDMSAMAGALNYLHELQIAHGDIKLDSIQLHQGKPVLGNFERFSLLDQESRAQQIGSKKFLFYNNEFHAPELRSPNGLNKTWQYTYASKEGDIWSFGMMLAAALHQIPQGNEIANASRMGKPVWKLLGMSPGQFKQQVAKQSFLAKSPLEFHFRHQNNTTGTPYIELSITEETLLHDLQKLINDCTRASPKERPFASEVIRRLVPLQ